ncbi:GAF domain-containing protein [Actinoplanes sp. NPDC026670]|uniref:GAF domain-containing protein n=1 Tax=Actinoplanes sp. NPDC026670 TaxID=3154700 RepID=UPI003409C260
MSLTAASDAFCDAARVAAVHRYEILDTPTSALDPIARTAATVCGTPIATVSIIDADRVWFAASTGLDGIAQTGTEPGLCASALLADGPYLITDTTADPRTRDHPLVRGEPGLRFYAAAPIISSDGWRIGTVGVFDNLPRQVTDMHTTTLLHLADIVARHLDQRLTALVEVRNERRLRHDAEQRATAAYGLTGRRTETNGAAQDPTRPVACQLGGTTTPCTAPAVLKIADSWGDSAWGCTPHVEDAILNVRSTFIASEELGGLADHLHRP